MMSCPVAAAVPTAATTSHWTATSLVRIRSHQQHAHDMFRTLLEPRAVCCAMPFNIHYHECSILTAGCMSLGSITDLLSEMPRPTDLGAGQILLQSRGPGELFFGATLVPIKAF